MKKRKSSEERWADHYFKKWQEETENYKRAQKTIKELSGLVESCLITLKQLRTELNKGKINEG